MPVLLEDVKTEVMNGSLPAAGDLLPLPLWLLDPGGNCYYTNRRWQELMGQKAGYGLGKSWEASLHPNDLLDYRREREIAGKSREFNVVLRLRRFDGSYRFFHTIFSPHLNAKGQPIGHIAYGIDIHDIKRSLMAAPSPPPEENERPAEIRPPEPPRQINPATGPAKVLEVLLASEERLRWVFEHIPVMVVALDDQNRIVSWNRECEHVTGYRAEEAIGNEALLSQLFHHPTDQEWLLTPNGVEKKTWLEHGCDLCCKGGAIKTVAIKNVSKNVPIPGWKGWWVALDITDRKQSEIALRESEARLRLAMRTGHMGIWDWNLQSNEVVFSETQDPLFGLAPGSFPGTYQDFLDRVHPDDRPRLSRAIREAIEQRRDYELEFRIVWPEGGHRWLMGKGQAIYDESDQAIRMLGLTMDITERKRSETEKLLMERRLQEAQRLESIGVLAGGIAHDFNNILTSILGNASLARMELSTTADVQQYLKRIEDASLRAADLCKQMLAYAGKGRFFEQELDVNELIKDSESMLQSLITNKAVLTYHFGHNLPTITADPSQIRQVLINLVVNASEVLGDQGGTITVASAAVQLHREAFADYTLVSNLTEGTYVMIEVSDNGCGMTPGTIERIFDPFFSTKFAGRGLGLAAVQGIVRGHQGAIKVRSELGRGTTIQLLFPGVVKSTAHAPNPHPALQGTVLVIDDEETVLTVTESFLQSYGLKVLLAKDGVEGVSVFREHRSEVSAVLLDFSMPRLDGVRTFAELRRIQDNIRVFLMSGYNEQDATVEFVGQGLSGFIQKPFNLELLYEKLKTVLIAAAPS